MVFISKSMISYGKRSISTRERRFHAGWMADGDSRNASFPIGNIDFAPKTIQTHWFGNETLWFGRLSMNFCVFGNPSVRPPSADQIASPATKSNGPRNPWVWLFLVFFRDFIEHTLDLFVKRDKTRNLMQFPSFRKNRHGPRGHRFVACRKT